MKIVTTALILAAVVILCCTAMPKKRFCSRKPKTGPCRASFERFFYNATSKRCETFTYGGCDGNKNRFTSFLSCMQTCHKCPLKGQIVHRCAPCGGTCEQPLVPCPRICRVGCACPSGQTIDTARKRCVTFEDCPPIIRCRYNGQDYKPGQTFNSTDGCNTCTCSKKGTISCTEKACIPESCPVPGQVYSNCSSPCTFTCANVDRISCITLCVKGCGCPSGQVIDEDKNKCVPISECPGREPVCPIMGQIMYRCAPCDGTCNQPSVPCKRIKFCTRGCACHRGQVIDPARNRCVPLSACPPRCPIQGQWYFNASEGKCVPCTGTCEDTSPVCTRECRSGCGCPTGTVLDEENKQCIHPRTCPKKCEYEGEVYEPGDRWDCSDIGKCMKCWCLANGVVVNNTIGCPQSMCTLKNGTKVPHGTFYKRTPCQPCTCINGKFHCAVQLCARPRCENAYKPPGECCPRCPPPPVCWYNRQFYKPGETFNSTDGCNTCTCSMNSTVSCTERACRPKMICPPPFGPGVCAELCNSDDDCELDERCCSNGCGHQCTKGTLCAAVSCLRPSCPVNDIIPPGPDQCCGTCGCRYGGKLYRPGQTFPSIDGCNNCTCLTGGRIICTRKACEMPKCPIKGQIYYGGDRCAPCDGTCEQPVLPCPKNCRRGCACPIGQVIDRAQNRCVSLSECLPPTPVCPKPIGPGICVERCSRDKDCFAGQKCCSNGCGHVCTTIVNCAVVLCLVPKCDFPTGVVASPPAGWCCPGCGCRIGGKVVRIGEGYKSGCNQCICTMRGPICAPGACPPPGTKG